MISSTPFFYSVYGFTLKSNVPFPHLPASPPRKHDAEVELVGESNLEELPAGAIVDSDGTAVLVEADGGRVIRYTDARDGGAIQLHFGHDGSRVRVAWTAGKVIDDIPAAVLGPLLGTCARLLGVVLLHSGAVVVDGGAVLLMGVSGAGKSTTTAALMKRGHPVLSDDLVALDARGDGVWVQPAPGQVRLTPDAALALDESPSDLPPDFNDPASTDAKRLLDAASGGLFHRVPVRATALYFLERSREGSPRPTLVPLSVKETVPRLLQNLYIRGRPDRELSGRAFRTCAQLASTCRSYSVRGALRLDGLRELADLIAMGKTSADDLDSSRQ